MAELAHYCTGCGEVHGGKQAANPEIEIARINAERDVEVARLARSETKLAVEGQVEATEVAVEGQVEEAVVKAEVMDEIINPPEEPTPVVVVEGGEGGDAEAEAPQAEPPEAEDGAGVPAASRSSSPWW